MISALDTQPSSQNSDKELVNTANSSRVHVNTLCSKSLCLSSEGDWTSSYYYLSSFPCLHTFRVFCREQYYYSNSVKRQAAQVSTLRKCTRGCGLTGKKELRKKIPRDLVKFSLCSSHHKICLFILSQTENSVALCLSLYYCKLTTLFW